MTLASWATFALFFSMLAGLLLFHHHKLPVVVGGFSIIAIMFAAVNGAGGLVSHFSEWHRFHLLYNLAFLLPGFSLVAYYFEDSGASHGMAKLLKTDAMILWSVFALSTILDNIAACMIGGTILIAVYGRKNVPFSMLVGVICASNLGGAGSPVGDTTTVMMFVSQDPKISVFEIFSAMFAAIPAQILICLWAARHGHHTLRHLAAVKINPKAVETYDDRHLGEDDARALDEGAHRKTVRLSMMLTLLAIPGLIVGNLFDQPAAGLWAGLIIGMILGRTKFERAAVTSAVPNTLFLLLLVAAAEMLPLQEARPYLDLMDRDVIAILMGHLSAWFDNIPLTAVCLSLKGFDWGLLAYCVGYGGSAMWFGSSAGVALGVLFKEVYETRRWGVPFLAVTLTYWAGAIAYFVTFSVLLPWAGLN